MRRAAALAVLLLAGALPAEAATLTVTVENVRNSNGDIRLSIFASPAEWPSHSTTEHDLVQPAHAGSVVFKLDLPPGTYAINGFHDENRNVEFDRTAIGLPEEGYFFSDNAKPFLSAPSFKAASFTLPPQGAAITTRVVYP
jgi:uncharacterized protein (DUF2141 family)